MSIGGALSGKALAALGDDGPSVSMRWLEMLLPDNTEVRKGGLPDYYLRVVEEPTNARVRLIKTPLNLISVMGPARSGKSTLMNMLAGCTTSELFPTSSGMITHTKGIYVPTRILSLSDFASLEGGPPPATSDSQITVTLVDTEGQGAVGAGYDMNLFSPALLMSRVVIYNRTGGLLTEEILNQLAMMAQAAQRLQISDPGDKSAPKRPPFGHLMIIFNQFRLNPKDNATTIQKELLESEPGLDGSSQKRNEIRQLLKDSFESIKVYILPDQLSLEARDALADGTKPFILLSDFTPKYREYFKLLRTALSDALAKPRELTPGTPLNGGTMADFMPSFAQAINKAEPLNVPSIFELSQNGAINKALVKFSALLRQTSDTLLKEDAKPTLILGNQFDTDQALLLQQMVSLISYMPTDIVDRTRTTAVESAGPIKEGLLANNLVRLREIMLKSLDASLVQLGKSMAAAFTDEKLLRPWPEVEKELQSITDQSAETYQRLGNQYDRLVLADNWKSPFELELTRLQPLILARHTTVCLKWLNKFKAENMSALTQKLVALGDDTKTGTTDQYESDESVLSSQAKADFSSKVSTEYYGSDAEAQKKLYNDAVDELCSTRRAIWKKSAAAIVERLRTKLTTLQITYKMKLQNAIPPLVEPPIYSEITDASDAENELQKFLADNKVDSSTAEDNILRFRTFIAELKADFSPKYTEARVTYEKFLTDKFALQVPLLLKDFQSRLDRITIKLQDRNTTKTTINNSCDTEVTETRNAFNTFVRTTGARETSVISGGIVQTARGKLETGLKTGKEEKSLKYDELVTVYNRALLGPIAKQIVDKTLGNKYPTTRSLDDDISAGKSQYIAGAVGETAVRDSSWDNWYNVTKDKLYEIVRRFNAFPTQALDAVKIGNTREIQEEIVKKIYTKCADMGSGLGMGWLSSSNFNANAIEDMGRSGKSRTLKMTNNGRYDGYWGDVMTSLEFFEWEAEISDIIYGEPVLAEMKPFLLNSYDYTALSEPMEVSIGSKSTVTQAVEDSFNWELGFGMEVENGGKVTAGVAEATSSVKVSFNAKVGGSFSNKLETSFETDTSAKIILPPNRTSTISQVVFDQRTSLCYTAKVKLVPKLKFTGGFTLYGDGGSYRDNPKTSAIKDDKKDGDRTRGTRFFPRCDEIQRQARANGGDWYWLLAMERKSWLRKVVDDLADPEQYTVYVRGKWEGITGKRVVVMVTPKSSTDKNDLLP